MLNYKRFTFNYRHSVFYCISKYYLRGETYMTEEEKKRRQIDEKEVRSVLGIEEPDEDITRMAKKGW